MRMIDIVQTFTKSAQDLSAISKDSCADIIARAHMISQCHARQMSATELRLEIEHLRDDMQRLSAAFTKLDFAHSAMTVGETASRIRAAAET